MVFYACKFEKDTGSNPSRSISSGGERPAGNRGVAGKRGRSGPFEARMNLETVSCHGNAPVGMAREPKGQDPTAQATPRASSRHFPVFSSNVWEIRKGPVYAQVIESGPLAGEKHTERHQQQS